MTPREQAAFAAGIETARQMALITAMTIKARDGSGIVRDRAAAAALQGLAAGLKVAFLDPQQEPTPVQRLMTVIAADDGTSGTAVCPACKGRLTWVKDSYNDHIHAECETPECFRLMQ